MTYNGYLIDLDGTIYLGNERIETAVRFIKNLHKHGVPYLFVTNNSAKTPEQVAKTLNDMDIPATPGHVFTSGMATAKYIRKIKENARCYMIGGDGLQEALVQEGAVLEDTNCDFSIIGMDRHITFEKYAKACLAVRDGATFLSTNADASIPTERGMLPGNGALTSVITVSTGVEPTFIGKPEAIMMEEALRVLGTTKSETLMIGDNYETDIKAGLQSGIDTLMVLTGVTQYEDLAHIKEKPTYYVENLEKWLEDNPLGETAND